MAEDLTSGRQRAATRVLRHLHPEVDDRTIETAADLVVGHMERASEDPDKVWLESQSVAEQLNAVFREGGTGALAMAVPNAPSSES